MDTQLECLPCFLSQAIRTARLATNDKDLVKKATREATRHLLHIDLNNPPAQIGAQIHRLIKEITANDDPFINIKRESTRQALAFYPRLKEMVAGAVDPMLAAIKVAIAGNIIDFGVTHTFNLENELSVILNTPLAIDHYQEFREHLQAADQILYLGDNAGETVFDRILIEQIARPTTFVVREGPVINDATEEDAREAGLDRVATIISSGAETPATILSLCSPEFMDIFKKAEFIISKGQGNFEALSDITAPIFYLLKAKCRVVADYLKVSLGDIILKVNQYFETDNGEKK
jgi:uncharacterized protein with ATP-grasp and redox domains